MQVQPAFRVSRGTGVRAATGAVFDGGREVFEDLDDVFGVDMRQAKGTDTGGIDDPAAVRGGF